MQPPEIKKKIFIIEGVKIGDIEVIGPVIDILHHPEFDNTPPSYIKQGHIWECSCSCGKVFLISEYVLQKGENKSCGCKRRMTTKSEISKQRMYEWRIDKMRLNNYIRELQLEQNHLQMTDSRFRDEKRLSVVGELLRASFSQKASLQAKYHPNKNKYKLANISDEE
jgi:hypothetical protein